MHRLLLKIIFSGILFFQSAYAQHDTATRTWGDWHAWGDQGDGTYLNPILPADYSDLDCIAVGSDFYAVSSTFQYAPGFIVLHSKDLVNWSVLGHVVDDISTIAPEMSWNSMNRYGRGIWAGAIRYHDKKFWVYFGDPDRGYFMSTAEKAGGPWAPLHPVLQAKGWDDCCPFWDDDGQGYLVGTNFSDGYAIHLFKLTPDGRELIRESDKIIHQSKGSEANKLYKINGLYYHFFSEVKPEGRAVMMERARNIWGPYTEVKQLSHAQKQFNEPNQGGIVQTQAGDWYFLTHHGTGDWSGRVMSLLPVRWVNGWPILGEPGADGIGGMVWRGKMPVKGRRAPKMQPSDEFDQTTLAPQWEWNYQPRKDKWSLTERKGWLRLHAFTPLEPDNLLKAGNTLTQRTLRTYTNEVVVKLDISGMQDGQRAGLSHFGSPNYSTLGVICDGAVRKLAYAVKKDLVTGPVMAGKQVWLKSAWSLDGKSQYYYSTDGRHYTAFGAPYQMMWGAYRGDRIAVYNYNNLSEAGYVDIDFFRYKWGKSR